MKKLFILLPVAAFMLASCSSDEVVEQNPSKVIQSNALQIYPSIQGVTRAATIWDNGNFTKFKLNASHAFQTGSTAENPGDPKTFAGEVVEKKDGVWGFSGDATYWWPSKSTFSNFVAWAPTDISASSYTASTTIGDQKDIVVAFNEGTASTFESGVPLKFRHILSQIVVKADNSAASDVQITVKGVRLNNVASNGTWKLPTQSTVSSLQDDIWSSVGTAASYLPTLSKNVTLSGSAAEISGSDPILLIPQQLKEATASIKDADNTSGQYISVLVNIKNLKPVADNNGKDVAIYPKADAYDADKFAWAAVDVNTKWEAGKKYIYTLHFTKDGYGKIDADQGDGGTDKPGGTGEDDPGPGDDVVDTPVKLILDVEVIDFEEVKEDQNL